MSQKSCEVCCFAEKCSVRRTEADLLEPKYHTYHRALRLDANSSLANGLRELYVELSKGCEQYIPNIMRDIYEWTSEVEGFYASNFYFGKDHYLCYLAACDLSRRYKERVMSRRQNKAKEGTFNEQ